jgi:hypothetical protein
MNGMADFLASQPMHVGFTSDQGGNSIELRWFRHKSNLHHVTKSCFACVAHDSIPSPPRCWSKRCPMDGFSACLPRCGTGRSYRRLSPTSTARTWTPSASSSSTTSPRQVKGTGYLILIYPWFLQAKKHVLNASTTRCMLALSQGTWSDDVSAWTDCQDLSSCPTKFVLERYVVNSFSLDESCI